MRLPLTCAATVLCLVLLPTTAWPQSKPSGNRTTTNPNADGQTAPWAPTSSDLKFHKTPPRPGETDMDKQLQQADTEKEQLKQNAARLLKLIGEIKDDLDDSPAGTVGSDDLKKSEEIEKLAKKLHKAFQSETK